MKLQVHAESSREWRLWVDPREVPPRGRAFLGAFREAFSVRAALVVVTAAYRVALICSCPIHASSCCSHRYDLRRQPIQFYLGRLGPQAWFLVRVAPHFFGKSCPLLRAMALMTPN